MRFSSKKLISWDTSERKRRFRRRMFSLANMRVKMPPRTPAANELIADKRCYTEHGVLVATHSHHPGCPLPVLAGVGPSRVRHGEGPNLGPPSRDGTTMQPPLFPSWGPHDEGR